MNIKKIILILLILISIPTFAQQEKASVKVVSTIEHQLKPVNYFATVLLELNSVYSKKVYDLDVLKKDYFEALKKEGIDPSLLIENGFIHLIVNTNRKGTSYILKTASKDVYEQFLGFEFEGMFIIEKGATVTFTDKENEELLKKAFKKAKVKANAIAKTIRKKVGEVISISSNAKTGTFNQNFTYYSAGFNNDFQLTVTFELK